jgi:hypothetical protein
MKEMLTKKFWQEVKKTFEEARDGPAKGSSLALAEGRPGDDSPAEAPTPPKDETALLTSGHRSREPLEAGEFSSSSGKANAGGRLPNQTA